MWAGEACCAQAAASAQRLLNLNAGQRGVMATGAHTHSAGAHQRCTQIYELQGAPVLGLMWSCRSLTDAENDLRVDLCRLEMAIRAARMA